VIGLLADVHGNLPALEAILADAAGVDRWLVAGDLVGHLPFPDEVVERVASLEAQCVLGNHDRALLQGLDIPGSRSGTLAIRDQRARARPETRAFLASLPLTWEADGLFLVHGSPFDPLEERLYALDERVREWLGGRTLVVGHSHRQLAEDGLVNPGTAGLPTDGDPRTAYGVLRDDGTIELRRLVYDPAPCIDRLAELGFDDAYANCLRTGTWVGPTVST
jgi:putative phosphoesterase